MPQILIVDDSASNRDYLVTLLGYGGHRLLQAADGTEALAIARRERPDLIIADILMPTMDGYELVRQLRADPAIAQIQVIFWTAHFHEREAQSLARTCGVARVITKPSEPEAVLEAVEAALGIQTAAPAQPAVNEFDRDHLRLLTDKLSQKAEDLRATNERLSALVDLSLQLGSELDLDRLIQSFCDAARQIVGARYSIVGILDPGRTGFQSVHTSGMDAETAARLELPAPQSAALRVVLEEGRAQRLWNPGGDPAALGFSLPHPKVHAWLGAPISSPNQVYGYVGLIDRIGLEEFSSEDERLAGILAAQVGRVYQNGSLYADVLNHAANLEREVAGRTLIGEVGAALTRCDAMREMLQSCAQALVSNLGVAFARIWRVNEEENVLELEASAGLYTHIDGPHSRLSMSEGQIGRIAGERKPHFTNEVLADSRVVDKEWARREKMIAFAGYPLVIEDRSLGVLGMFSRQPLTEATIDAIGSVAHEIALGIERYRTTDALREREEHIRLLLDSTGEAIYGVDLEGRCTFANSACARLLRHDHPSQLLGQSMHFLVPDSGAHGEPHSRHVIDAVLRRADGSSFPAEYWSHPIYRKGEVVGRVVTFLDITERRQLESRVQRAQERLRHVVVSSPAVLFTLAIEENRIEGISWTSENVTEIFGYSAEAAVGAEWWVAGIHPDDLERIAAQTRSDLFTRGHSIQEYRFRHAAGHYCWTRCEMRLIRDAEGKGVEAVGSWSDITQAKIAQEEQAKLRGQLQQAQKLESIGRLAGGVAHDFNNLLTVINGYSDMLMEELDPADPAHESASEIRTAGERAAALSAQLLLLSRKQVVQPAEVNLNDIIREVEKMLGRVIGEDIRLESVLSPTLGYVLADPGQLHQVLMNLAVNARDAMPGGGTLLIETTNMDLGAGYIEQHAEVEPGRYVQLKVSDTGTGIPKEVMAHLFEPFFTTKKQGEGTGLGLATVYGIVKQCGGSIWVYTEPGHGTSFKIYLPRIEHSAPAAETKPPAPPLGGTEVILIVEDQEQLRKMAARALRGHGYKVIEAANPEEAWQQSENCKGPIHLMLTDVVMPGMSGRDLANRLKPSRPLMEVIFMSGYSERVIVDRQMLAEGCAYLSKPFSPESLAMKVREVLGGERAPGTIVIADDEPAIRSLLRKILAGEGYTVIEARNGKEAVEQIEARDADLLITDLAMPEQEGIETIGNLRRKRPRLRIIAMSGVFAGPMLRAAEALGAHASLAKPIQADALLATVRRVMSA